MRNKKSHKNKQVIEQKLNEVTGLINWIKNNPTKAILAGDFIRNYVKDNAPHSWEKVGKALTDVGADVVDVGSKIIKGISKGAEEKGITIPTTITPSQTRSSDAVTAPPSPLDRPLPDQEEAWGDKPKYESYAKVLDKYALFLNEKKEQQQKSSFELEVEKNFSDPHTRAAIMAKARQESGGKNIGEYSYAKNSNDHIRTVFKGNRSIERLSDAELSALKQNPTAFFDVAYGHLGGFKYRGRGPIQITGKANYARIDRDLGLNGELVKNPDLLLQNPELANAASIQYLKNAGLHKKSYNNQRDAHLDVIYAIGGPSYAPNSWRSNKVYAQLVRTQGLPNTNIKPLTTDLKANAQPPALPDKTVNTKTDNVPLLPIKTADKTDAQVPSGTTVASADDTGTGYKFNADAWSKAIASGEDMSDYRKFITPYKTSVNEKANKYRNGSGSKGMKDKEVVEAGAMSSLDNIISKGKDITSTAGLGALATQLPRVPELVKKVGAKALPGLNIAYQAADAAQRAQIGDPVGAAIAGASAVPVLAIPGVAAQAIRDKSRTGSFFPDKEELEKAAAQDKSKGGYFKARASDYDPSFLPENTQMKRLTNLRLSVIKEELNLKKCSMTEQQVNERFFYYFDGKKTIFNEDGYVIGHVDTNGQVVLNEASLPPWAKDIGPKLKKGWDWVSTNVPPAYRKGKEVVGKTADELASLYQAGKGAASAIGREIVDVPKDIATKLKTAWQDVRKDIPKGLPPEQRPEWISNYDRLQQLARIEKAEADLAIARSKVDAAKAKGLGKAEVDKAKAEVEKARAEAEGLRQQTRQTKAAADIAAGEVPLLSPRTKQMGKIAGGTGLTLGGVDVGLQYDPEIGTIPGGYEVGKGFKQLVTPQTPAPTNESDLKEEETFAQKIRRMLGLDQPEPPKPQPPKPEPPKPEPPKPEPPKPEPPKPDPPKPEKADDKDGLDVPHSNLPQDYKPDRTQDGSDKVRAMQRKLRDAGYGSLLGKFGPEGDGVDGKWGKFTQQAYDAYMADKQAKKAIQKAIDPSLDPYDPKKDTTIKYTELPNPADKPGSKTITPTVPVKAYIDDYEPKPVKGTGLIPGSEKQGGEVRYGPDIKIAEDKFAKDLKTILKLAGRQ